MNTIVIEHVPVNDLPEGWRARLPSGSLVTVRIEAEATQPAEPAPDASTDDSLFGMWRDREDIADVAAYVRTIRAGRFGDEATGAKR